MAEKKFNFYYIYNKYFFFKNFKKNLIFYFTKINFVNVYINFLINKFYLNFVLLLLDNNLHTFCINFFFNYKICKIYKNNFFFINIFSVN